MKDRAGMLLKNQTSRRKQNPLSTALKQRHPKIRLQISHLLRNTRLRNSEPVSCTAKASSFGDCKKIAQVADIQRLRHGNGILSGGLAKCNEELDSRKRFCFHRQNLLRYFPNFWTNDSTKTDRRHRA